MRTFLSALLIVTLAGCASNRITRVAQVKSETVKSLAPDVLVYSNDTLDIKYYFWAENGSTFFVLVNKLDKPIYIDWKKSNIILNNVTYPYWVDEQRVAFTTIGSAYTFQNNPYLKGLQISNSGSYGYVSKPERVSFIAPKASYAFSGVSLKAFCTVPADYKGHDSTISASYKPSKKESLRIRRFTNTTPLVFRNYITLSTTEDFKSEFSVDNTFWMSETIAMREKQFRGRKHSADEEGFYDYPYRRADKFYYFVE